MINYVPHDIQEVGCGIIVVITDGCLIPLLETGMDAVYIHCEVGTLEIFGGELLQCHSFLCWNTAKKCLHGSWCRSQSLHVHEDLDLFSFVLAKIDYMLMPICLLDLKDALLVVIVIDGFS